MGTLGNYATILVGAVLVVCGILLFVRQKKKNALPAEEQTVYQYPQQPGAPGANGYPQQSYAAPPQNDPFYQPTAQPPFEAPQQGEFDPNAGGDPPAGV